ncbi:MAG: hypothetical protein ACF8XB_21070, partial [Planctomycetota bacterium JB042]
MDRHRAASLALLSLFALAGPAAGQHPFELHVVVPTGSYPLNSSGLSDVSNEGRVVGSTYENDVFRWFEWSAGAGFSWLPVMFQSSTHPTPSPGRLNDVGDRLFSNLLLRADGTLVQIPYVDGSIGLPGLRDRSEERR